jgi:hypothetical protein
MKDYYLFQIPIIKNLDNFYNLEKLTLYKFFMFQNKFLVNEFLKLKNTLAFMDL